MQKLIVQVLVNLLDNAIKHSSHCRELDVYVSKKDKDVMFTVEDQERVSVKMIFLISFKVFIQPIKAVWIQEKALA